jgi:hypothetical protein
MLTWAIAYAVARGASENWFWMALPFDFLLAVTLMQTVKEFTRVKAMLNEMATSPLFTKMCDD